MVVLAGYSQGAMVIHNVLNELLDNSQANYLSMIKGAALIADPERMKPSNVLNLGSAPSDNYGVCHTLDEFFISHSPTSASCVPPNYTSDVANYFASTAVQICDTNDLACDTSDLFKLNNHGVPRVDKWNLKHEFTLGKWVHTNCHSYCGSEAITTGHWIARNLIADGLGATPSPSPSPPSPSPSPTPTPTPTGATSWTATEAPLPTGVGAPYSVHSLACPSSSSCVALAGYQDSSGAAHSLLLTGSGTSWTATSAPTPANSVASPYGPRLRTVVCPTLSACVAVGEYIDTSGNAQGLLVTGSRSSWTATEAPRPANASESVSGPSIESVACLSSSACVAVGEYIDTSGHEQGLLLTGSGSSWTATEAPLPANAGNGTAALTSVACSASLCTAIGSYTDSSGWSDSLLVTGSGSSWTSVEPPLPSNSITPGGYGGLSSVTCQATACVVIGEYNVSSGDQGGGLLLTGSGSSWTAIQAPLPASAGNVTLRSVACPSDDNCIVVGDGVIITGFGSSWTATEPPVFADSNSPSDATLDSVACASLSACVVVGIYRSSSGGDWGLVLTGSGTSWTAEKARLPNNAVVTSAGLGDSGLYSDLISVVCNPAACDAIGFYSDTSGNTDGLIVSGGPGP